MTLIVTDHDSLIFEIFMIIQGVSKVTFLQEMVLRVI